MSNPSNSKKEVQIREQIFHNLVNILESFTQYTVAQHMLHVLRRKGDAKEPYFWDNDEFLKKLEHYVDELQELRIEDKVEEDRLKAEY